MHQKKTYPLLSCNSALILKVQNVSLRLDVAEFMM
jgi:hypothetical protein